jgi:hypothetical protein
MSEIPGGIEETTRFKIIRLGYDILDGDAQNAKQSANNLTTALCINCIIKMVTKRKN